MPLTVEENLVGQLWSFAENSRLNTSGGEGVTVQKNEFFDIPYAEDGRVHFEKLPEYENLDLSVQNAQSKSSKSAHIKKSASKDSFDKTKHVHYIAERCKSLDLTYTFFSIINSYHSRISVELLNFISFFIDQIIRINNTENNNSNNKK